MSVCRECHIVEVDPGRWYVMLEHTNAPRDAWSWKEYADCFGPFPNKWAAFKELDNHSNPGGHSIISYAPDNREQYASLLAKAQKSSTFRRW